MDKKLTTSIVSTAIMVGTLAWLTIRRNTVRVVDSTPSSTKNSSSGSIFLDANMPRDAAGRTFHLNVKPGDGKYSPVCNSGYG